MANDTSDILFHRLQGKHGCIGEVILNRPRALNTITGQMFDALSQQLIQWAADPDVHAVLIKGAGDRAFCAGGDVRQLYNNRDNPAEMIDFFTREYELNRLIHHYPKPYISVLDGITMGGGCGVSLHGSHPIATERLQLAMPETRIGLFPDVVVSYLLAQCPHHLGLYMALTGDSIDARRAYQLGLVRAVINSKNVCQLQDDLLQADWSCSPNEVVDDIIARFTVLTHVPQFIEEDLAIERCLSLTTLTEAMSVINSSSDVWAIKAQKSFAHCSPLLLCVVWEQFYRLPGMSFEAVAAQDLQIVSHALRGDEFFEGVRAMLVDKDYAPQWLYETIEQVPQEAVSSYF